MEATEFRIGNYAYGTDGTEQIITLEALKYLVKYAGTLNQARPIPLTKDYYERFGFTWSQKRCTWTKGDLTICNWNDEVQYISVGTDDVDYEIEPSPGFIKIKKLNYVHELQNLYFSLKREELVQSGFVLTI